MRSKGFLLAVAGLLIMMMPCLSATDFVWSVHVEAGPLEKGLKRWGMRTDRTW